MKLKWFVRTDGHTYLYYSAEHRSEQWTGSVERNIAYTCFSIMVIHPMFENMGILAVFIQVRIKYYKSVTDQKRMQQKPLLRTHIG